MRQLRFVRLAEDAGHLVLAADDGTEQFALANDSALRAAVGTEAAAPGPGRPPSGAAPGHPGPQADGRTSSGAEVGIGPRDIQVRIRAGESPQELADSLGVELDRVLRFARPVVEERQRIAGEARRARARRSRPEGAESTVVVFGEAVDERFSAHGIVATDVVWDSRRRDDGDWVVDATWLGGEGRHTAEWVFHRGSRTVTPLDDTASDLLSDRPIRPIVPPVEAERPSLVAAPPLAPGVVAFPPMAEANTGPLPRLEEVFDQEAPAEGPRDLPPYVGASAQADPDLDAPPLPLGITDPPARPHTAGALPPRPSLASLTNLSRAKRDEPEEDRAARARVPSWDDILLGVRRKQD